MKDESCKIRTSIQRQSGDHVTEIGAPLVKSSIADAHLAANFINPVTGLCLLKCKGNLLVRKSALFHGMFPFSKGEISCRIFLLLNG